MKDLEQLAGYIHEWYEVPLEKITVDADLREDLGLDSLDLMELVMSAEEEYRIEIPEEKWHKVKTIGDVLKLLEVEPCT